MAFIIKTRIRRPDDKQRLLVTETPFEGASPRPGDAVFVWFSESQRGSGLTYQGRIAATGEGSPMPILVQVEKSCPEWTLINRHIASDRSESSPYRELYQKLYEHASHKVVEISAETAGHLSSLFEPSERASSKAP